MSLLKKVEELAEAFDHQSVVVYGVHSIDVEDVKKGRMIPSGKIEVNSPLVNPIIPIRDELRALVKWLEHERHIAVATLNDTEDCFLIHTSIKRESFCAALLKRIKGEQ